MQSKPTTPDEYIASLPEERKTAVSAIRKAINKNIPKGFKEGICYGTIGWVVPHSLFPPGYHCDPAKPLMLMSLGSTKGHISLHHMRPDHFCNGFRPSGLNILPKNSIWARAVCGSKGRKIPRWT